MRGRFVKITIAVMTPAIKSAMPSERYTPLKPGKCVSTKHSGIRMTTLRVTASSSAESACPSATLIFCSVICTKNMIEPIKNSGAYRRTISVTVSLAENSRAYSSGMTMDTGRRFSSPQRRFSHLQTPTGSDKIYD